MKLENIGRWAFLVGFLLAIIFGFVDNLSDFFVAVFLVILGFIVGLLDINKKDYPNFLIGVIAIIVLGIAGLDIISIIPEIDIGGYVHKIIRNITIFVGIAGFVVAKKLIFSTLKKPKLNLKN